VDLRTAEDRPLSPAQAERVARLAEEHGEHLVRYVRARLDGWAYWAQAEDVAQDVWVAVARGRVPELLEESPDLPWPRLAATAKWAVLEAARTRGRREWLVWEGDDRSADEVLESLMGPGPDSTVCAVEELLEAEGGSATGWAPACYAERIAALSPRQREVLELRCDGMSQEAVAARLGISGAAVNTHMRAAVASLRGESSSLPDGWERVLHRLSSKLQRDMVRLIATGVSQREAARRLGISRNWGVTLYQRAVRSLREMVADHRMDPVPAAVPAGRSCASCTTGCRLRTGRKGGK
jgi:DNA-binding CsgD family transcriptional regulator